MRQRAEALLWGVVGNGVYTALTSGLAGIAVTALAQALVDLPIPVLVGIGLTSGVLVLEGLRALRERRIPEGSAQTDAAARERGERLRAKAEAERRRGIAEFLSNEHTFGVHHLLNDVPDLHDGNFLNWMERDAVWVERIVTTLRERGCPLMDIRIIEPLGPPRHLAGRTGYRQDDLRIQRMDMVEERLGRILELQRRYEM